MIAMKFRFSDFFDDAGVRTFFQAYMKQLTGASSVPRVFIGGSCIGGGDETSAAHRSAASLVIQDCYQHTHNDHL